MADSIAVLGKDECCGCKACGDVCPTKAVSFTQDEEGFLYPSVQDTCVKCGLCTKICPVLNRSCQGINFEQSYFACFDHNKARRDSGSSGGVFGLLANRLMRERWGVYGAAFDDDLQLKHTLALNENELEGLKKSKYLQSDTAGIYSRTLVSTKKS